MNIKLRGLIFILVAALVISMCSFAALAEGDGPDAPESSDETLSDSSSADIKESGDVEEKSEETDDKKETEETDEKKETEGEDNDGEDKGDEEKKDDTEDEDDKEEESKKEGLSTTGLVFLIVLGAIIVIFFGFFIFHKGFRAKVIKFFREYKSELKKVVWSPKQDVVKNTKVVVITIVVFAVAIGLIDLGLGALIDLVGKIGG